MTAAQRRTQRRNGVWLVTYADLMTLLVCFFALIISFSVQDNAKMQVVAGSIRDAFGVTEERRFAGEVDLAGAPDRRQPGNLKPSVTPTADGLKETLSARPTSGAAGVDGAFANPAADRRRYEEAKGALERAIKADPLLRGADAAITVEASEEGMQIVLVDSTGAPMFELGSAEPTARARALLADVAKALKPLPNRIFIDGHADATGAGAYSPFELTAARANAAREALEVAGFPADRIAGVSGRGAAEPLYPEDPFLPGNRRIEIRLEPAAPLLPEDRSL
ncbi:MAG: OmpA family protein [Parvularculaceae bacterium]|nr:OmpA family protein [Parvularculaceae bacterium]